MGRPWIVITLFVCFALLAWVRYVYPSRLLKLIEATFNERMTKQMMREEHVFSNRASVLLLFLFSVSVSFHFYFIGAYFLGFWSTTDFAPFILILAGVVLFSLMHWAVHMASRFLLWNGYGIREYTYTIALINKSSVVLLLPLALILGFVSKTLFVPFVWLMLLVVLGLVLYRLYRGVRIALEHQVNWFYFICYLCALEILPILLMVKALSE
jgi:hypothetical protein